MESRAADRKSLEKFAFENVEEGISILKDLVEIPSIASEKAFGESCLKCAGYLKNFLEKIGFSVSFLGGDPDHPVIFAEKGGEGVDETLLFYTHYDVQPAEEAGWTTDPFTLVRSGDALFGRGAQDNKGQLTYLLWALKRAHQEKKKWPFRIVLCIDGQEECGSPILNSLLEENPSRFQAQSVVVVDVGTPERTIPAVTLGVRGIVTGDILAKGALRDAHSGSEGGILPNPVVALSKLIASFHDSEGRVTLPGFYDSVKEPSEEEKNWALEGDEEKRCLEEYRAVPTGGERAFSPKHRAWFRPTLEINGIAGGYAGSGFKTVIPAQASAKISCRLVPDQKPEEIQKMLGHYIDAFSFPGVSFSYHPHKGEGRAYRADPHSDIVKTVKEAYQEIFGPFCRLVFDGGSIPISVKLREASRGDLVLMGLGLASDQIHAPNEHFDGERLSRGARLITEILNRYAERVS